MKTPHVPLILILILTLGPASPLAAQHDHAGSSSSYGALSDRDIKALSEDEIASLLAGDGMSLALPAELNGYPGPRHVLELADSLELSGDQATATRALMDRMLSEARRIGERIVEGERALDQAFSDGTVDPISLSERVAALAALRGELRTVHLAAHLATRDILTLHQTHRYNELRGYGSAHGSHGG